MSLLLLLIVLLPDFYIRLVCMRGVALGWWNVLFWAPSAMVLLLALSYLFHLLPQPLIFKAMVSLVLLFAVPKLLFCMLSLLGQGAGAVCAAAHAPEAVRTGILSGFNMAGMGVAVLFLASSVYGLTAGPKRLEVREVELTFSGLPESFDGYRIVQLSDLHCSSYAAPGMVERLVGKVNSLSPDLIVFTGDMVNSSPDELDGRMTGVLSGLSARDGVFSVLGNHDYCEYRKYAGPDGPERSLAEVIRRERAMGWNLLMDSSAVISRETPGGGRDSIYVVGVQHCGKPPFGSRGDLQKALSDVPHGAFKILLSHDPSHWKAEVLPSSDVQLTLSGHTHAMQFRIGRFSPARWLYPEWYGVYRDGNRVLNVSAGIGGSFPFRLGAWPEIQVITLRRD